MDLDITEMFDVFMNLKGKNEDKPRPPYTPPYTQKKFICGCDEMYKVIDNQSGM